MKKSVICLSLMAVLMLTVRFTFAQEAQLVNENNSQILDSQGNSEETYVPVNTQDNSDVTIMPFVPQDNSENAVSSMENEVKNSLSL